MPFTPSHAVVALPFVRTPLVPAAIAIGAMTPDLPLFVRGLPLHYGRTHDLVWIPATVLLALVLLLVWRCALRPAVRELSPAWLAARLPQEWDAGAGAGFRETFGIRSGGPSARHLLLLILSLVLGVVTHIAWDAFTHEGRWGFAAIPALSAQWGTLPGYKWLQHGSSVLGLAILGVAGVVWLLRRSGSSPITRTLSGGVRFAWWISLPVALVVAWGIGLALLGPLDAEFTVAHLAYRVLPLACAVWGAGTLVLALVVQLRRARTAGVSAERRAR